MFGGDTQFDLSRIPPGTDIFALIARMPTAQLIRSATPLPSASMH